MKLFERSRIFNEREIKVLSIPVLQYGSRILLHENNASERYIRIFHKSVENQFLDHILSFIPKEHDCIFLMRTNGIGEPYVLNFMLDEFIRKNKVKCPCFIGHNEIHKELFGLFNNIPYYLDKSMPRNVYNGVLQHQKYKYKGKIFITYHAPIKMMSKYFIDTESDHYIDFLSKQLGVPFSDWVNKTPQISDEVRKTAEEKTMHINKEKFIFFVPDSQLMAQLPKGFGSQLTLRFQEQGYDVFVNNKTGKSSYGKSASLSLSEAYFLASRAKSIVALRCGFGEFLSTLPMPKQYLYTYQQFDMVPASQMVKILTMKQYPAIKPETVFEYNMETEESDTIISEIIARTKE
jgi:hypothetical protein